MPQPFNLTANLLLSGPSNLAATVTKIRTALQQAGQINIVPVIGGQALAQISNLVAPLNQLISTMQRTNAILQQGAFVIGKTGSAAGGAASQIKQTSSALEDFAYKSGLALKRYSGFVIGLATVYPLLYAFQNAIKQAVGFEKEMVKIAQTLGIPTFAVKGLEEEITRLSTTFGVSSKALSENARVLAQAGLAANETKIIMQALAKSTLSAAFGDLKSTTEGVIAIMHQFKIPASEVETALSQIALVSNKYAVESEDIVEAVRRAGGAFSAAGGNLQEFLALFTSVRQTTRESAETIATGLRTIFARLQSPRVVQSLEQIGLKLREMGEFIGPYRALAEISERLSKTSTRSELFAQVVELLGGRRQISKVIPLLTENALAQKVYQDALTGSNQLTIDAQRAQESLANTLAKVSEKWVAFVRGLMNDTVFKSFIRSLAQMATTLIYFADQLKSVLSLLMMLGTAKLGVSIATGIFTGGGIIGALKHFFQGLTGRTKARGGFIPGIGNSDTIPAMLTPGEFVINKKSAQAIGPNILHNLNRFQEGGYVPSRLNKAFSFAEPTTNKSLRYFTRVRQGQLDFPETYYDRIQDKFRQEQQWYRFKQQLEQERQLTQSIHLGKIGRQQSFEFGGSQQKTMLGQFGWADKVAQQRVVADQVRQANIIQQRTNLAGMQTSQLARNAATQAKIIQNKAIWANAPIPPMLPPGPSVGGYTNQQAVLQNWLKTATPNQINAMNMQMGLPYLQKTSLFPILPSQSRLTNIPNFTNIPSMPPSSPSLLSKMGNIGKKIAYPSFGTSMLIGLGGGAIGDQIGGKAGAGISSAASGFAIGGVLAQFVSKIHPLVGLATMLGSVWISLNKGLSDFDDALDKAKLASAINTFGSQIDELGRGKVTSEMRASLSTMGSSLARNQMGQVGGTSGWKFWIPTPTRLRDMGTSTAAQNFDLKSSEVRGQNFQQYLQGQMGVGLGAKQGLEGWLGRGGSLEGFKKELGEEGYAQYMRNLGLTRPSEVAEKVKIEEEKRISYPKIYKPLTKEDIERFRLEALKQAGNEEAKLIEKRIANTRHLIEKEISLQNMSYGFLYALDLVNQGFSTAIDSASGFQLQIGSLSEIMSGQIGFKAVNPLANVIANRNINPQEYVNSVYGMGTNLFGKKTGSRMADTAQQALLAQSVLPEIFSRMQAAPIEDPMWTGLSYWFEEQMKQGGMNAKSPLFQRVSSGFQRVVGGSGEGIRTEFSAQIIQKGKGEFDKLIDEWTSDNGDLAKQLEKYGELSMRQQQIFIDNLITTNELFNKYNDQMIKHVTLGASISAERQRYAFENRLSGTATLGGGDVFASVSDRMNLLSGNTLGRFSMNPEYITERAQQLQGYITGMEGRRATGTVDNADIANLVGARSEFINLMKVLESLSQQTDITANAQQRLTELQAAEQNRISVAERYATGGFGDRRHIEKSIAAAQLITPNTDIMSLSLRQRKLAIEGLGMMGNIQTPFGITGGQLKENVLLRSLGGLLPGFNNEINERNGIRGRIIGEQNRQLYASGGIATLMGGAVQSAQDLTMQSAQTINDNMSQVVQRFEKVADRFEAISLQFANATGAIPTEMDINMSHNLNVYGVENSRGIVGAANNLGQAVVNVALRRGDQPPNQRLPVPMQQRF